MDCLEMCRILEQSGRLLIYVWAKDQKKENLSSYLKQNKQNFKPGMRMRSSKLFLVRAKGF
jgi:hypothetical protein